eukprot:Nitzschia sp. Nitz4//scaffold18_size181773//170196//170756//NITZ4_001944-RA/size181773-processed-gene-0.30-mRNA-1//1//CDS//3329540098//5181//frame0
MAPRSDFPTQLLNTVEFKPRTGTWASYDTWSQLPSLYISDSSSTSSFESQQKSVRFSRNNDVVEYIHCTEFTPEEKAASWYAKADFRAMRNHNNDTIDKMTNRVPLDEAQESSVGLEDRTPLENCRTHQIMRNAMMAVLDEQDDQWRFDGYLNDEIIAARYQSYTWEARDRAYHIGRSQCLPVTAP